MVGNTTTFLDNRPKTQQVQLDDMREALRVDMNNAGRKKEVVTELAIQIYNIENRYPDDPGFAFSD
jgi:hypothetical protein